MAKSSKFSAVLKAVAWIGPLAVQAVRSISKNPELLDTIKEQATWLSGLRGGTGDDQLETIQVLRDQVAYLAESADDDDEARKAEEWSQRLDRCERAARILQAPGAPKADRTALTKKVNALRSEIFSAFITEQAEDAEKGAVAERDHGV